MLILGLAVVGLALGFGGVRGLGCAAALAFCAALFFGPQAVEGVSPIGFAGMAIALVMGPAAIGALARWESSKARREAS